MFIVYILKSETTVAYYIGQTNNIELRLNRHNTNSVTATKNRGPWNIVYTEEYPTRSEAMKREKYLKSLKSRIAIERLIAQSAESRRGRD
ncbi:GIY-YIG nuclease family protein [candidate division KSB1 bacterium]|nr:GIY-YIG nuclease family protein [candidate division KSB1 bacterium]